MEEQFEWSLGGRAKIKAEREGWSVTASTGAVFSETVIGELVDQLPRAAERFGQLLIDLPGATEHYERLGVLTIRVHGNRDEITANGLVVDLATIDELVDAIRDVIVKGDELVGRLRRGEVAKAAPKVLAWPAPKLPTPRIPLNQGVTAR